jgi:hypothetical protein
VKWRPPTVHAVIVALVVAMVAPGIWFAVNGTTYTTPTMTRAESDKMSMAEREAWIERNQKPVSLWEHLKGVPGYYVLFWVESLQISIAIFIIVLAVENVRRNLGSHEP